MLRNHFQQSFFRTNLDDVINVVIDGPADGAGKGREVPLSLPATCTQVEDALLRAGCEGLPMTVRVDQGGHKYLSTRFETVDLEEANYLASLVQAMSKVQEDCYFDLLRRAEQKLRRQPTVGEAVLLSLDVDSHLQHPGLTDDASLGRYLVEQGRLPEYQDISAYVAERLDYGRIGAEHRERLSLLMGDGLNANTEEDAGAPCYDVDVPEAEKPDYVYLLTVCNEEEWGRPGTEWYTLHLPSRESEIRGVMKKVDLDNAMYRCMDGVIPFPLPSPLQPRLDLAALDALAKEVRGLDEEEVIHVRALLEAKECHTIPAALELVRARDQYELGGHIEPTEYATRYLEETLGRDEAGLLAKTTDLTGFAKAIMKEHGVAATGYGIVRPAGLEQSITEIRL